jgi:hypothetical protein
MLEIKECNVNVLKTATMFEPTLEDFIFKHPVSKNPLPLPPISMLPHFTLETLWSTLALPHPESKWSGPRGCPPCILTPAPCAHPTHIPWDENRVGHAKQP